MGAQDRQTVITQKIVKYGTIDYPDYNLSAFDINGITNAKRWYDRIYHGLGYIPSYKAYVKVTDEEVSIFGDDPSFYLLQNNYQYVPFGASYSFDQTISGTEAVLRIVVVSGVDENYFYIGRWANNFADVPAIAKKGTVKYVIRSAAGQ